jgi:phosphatidylserine/phosphatidylglycerophosphate/cardiolipin synthase-like enzyme
LLLAFIFNILVHPQFLETYTAVHDYFKAAKAPRVDVRPFDVSHFARTHAKLFFFDDTEAVSLGSPFVQGYFDAPAHAIDNPQRGEAWHVPVHDVSCAVRGPAVADMHDTFMQHWNKAAPDNTVDRLAPADAVTPGTDEYPARIQIVRTLEPGMLPEVPKGEQGVLESYLRALEMAQDFIYFQNQYFTDDSLADAIIRKLIAKPTLQVIMVLPIAPDLPGYQGWQWGLVNRVRQGVAKAFGGNYDQHIEFFGRWTHQLYALHESGAPTRPAIIRNYIHAKVALADNRWGVVGSANLDGQSLTSSQMFQAIQPQLHRNTEVNCVFLPTQPAPAPEPVVDHLRRRLWAEDLGYTTGNDLNALDLNATDLNAPPADGSGWLGLFKSRADAKLAQLISAPSTIHPARLLRFPPLEKTQALQSELSGTTAHLLALGVPHAVLLTDLDVLAEVYPYSFVKGEFGDAQPLDGDAPGFSVPAGLV